MSAATKPRGGGHSELTRLKILWRDSLADDAREFWRSRFASDASQAEIRRQLLAKLKINLRFDKQLTTFRQWDEAQQEREALGERMEEREAELRTQNPSWSLEQVREELLKEAAAHAIANRDFKVGLKVTAGIAKKVGEDREAERFAEARKDEQAKALEYCLEEAKKFPEVQDLFKAAFAALKKARGAGRTGPA